MTFFSFKANIVSLFRQERQTDTHAHRDTEREGRERERDGCH